jgi:hypothetical protein
MLMAARSSSVWRSTMEMLRGVSSRRVDLRGDGRIERRESRSVDENDLARGEEASSDFPNG